MPYRDPTPSEPALPSPEACEDCGAMVWQPLCGICETKRLRTSLARAEAELTDANHWRARHSAEAEAAGAQSRGESVP